MILTTFLKLCELWIFFTKPSRIDPHAEPMLATGAPLLLKIWFFSTRNYHYCASTGPKQV